MYYWSVCFVFCTYEAPSKKEEGVLAAFGSVPPSKRLANYYVDTALWTVALSAKQTVSSVQCRQEFLLILCL